MVEARPKATAASSVTKSPAATSTALKKTGAAVISSAAKVTPGASKPAAPKGAAAAAAAAPRGASKPAAPRGAAAAAPTHTHISKVKGAQRDNYECPVCLELCAQPILTPCKHFMCFQCNKRVVAAGMTCPMCRAHFDKLFVP